MTALDWPVSQLVARLLMLLGPILALLATLPAGVPPPAWLGALVVVLAFAWAFLPESVLGTMAMSLVLLWWVVSDLGGLPFEAVVAALALVVAHCASVVVSYGPPELDLDTSTLRLWLTRVALLCVAAPAVWLLGVAFEDRPEPPGVWIAAMVAIVVAAVIAAVAYGSAEEEPVGDA